MHIIRIYAMSRVPGKRLVHSFRALDKQAFDKACEQMPEGKEFIWLN